MGFLSKLKNLLYKEKEIEVILNPIIKNKETIGNVSKEIKNERKKYQRIIKTMDIDEYVQSMVKKAYSEDRKITPYLGDIDQKEIEKILNKLKEDIARKI